MSPRRVARTYRPAQSGGRGRLGAFRHAAPAVTTPCCTRPLAVSRTRDDAPGRPSALAFATPADRNSGQSYDAGASKVLAGKYVFEVTSRDGESVDDFFDALWGTCCPNSLVATTRRVPGRRSGLRPRGRQRRGPERSRRGCAVPYPPHPRRPSRGTFDGLVATSLPLEADIG